MKKDFDRPFNGLSVENLLSQIKRMLESEYKRGAEDSMKTLAKVLGGNGEGRAIVLPKGARVPRGSSKAFVEKALDNGPKSIAGIRAMAETPVEKRLSYQTIRLELERGKKVKRYKKSPSGTWSIVRRDI